LDVAGSARGLIEDEKECEETGEADDGGCGDTGGADEADEATQCNRHIKLAKTAGDCPKSSRIVDDGSKDLAKSFIQVRRHEVKIT